MLTHPLNKAVRLGVQASGIQHEYLDVRTYLVGHVHQNDVLGTTERDDDVVELAQGEFQDFLGRGLLQFGVQIDGIE